MPKQFSYRVVLLLVALAMVGGVLAGCGSSNNDAGSQTGAGAPDGATGDAAGGAAPEAGKQVTPAEKKAQETTFNNEPPPVQIQSGVTSGIKVNSPKAIVVTSQKQENALRKKIYSDGSKKEQWAPTDFKTRQMVVLVMPQISKGSQVAITGISTNGKVIKVKAVQLTRGDGCKAGPKTNPWQAVETRIMPGTTTVELSKQQSSPC
jgi:hypothetical protein